MSDPDPAGQGPQGGEGATGAPNPGGEEVAQLKAENAKLREERRQGSAALLGAQHGLTPTQVELLSSVDQDKQGDYATKLAEEMKATKPATPSSEPKGPDLTKAQPPEDPALKAMDGDRGQQAVTPTTPESLRDELERRIKGAETPQDIEAIQREFREKAAQQRRESESNILI